jgi:hypothetical protein
MKRIQSEKGKKSPVASAELTPGSFVPTPYRLYLGMGGAPAGMGGIPAGPPGMGGMPGPAAGTSAPVFIGHSTIKLIACFWMLRCCDSIVMPETHR